MLRTILLQPLFNLLLLLYAIMPGHDFGLAVIALTILIRLLLWPLVRRQLHQQKKMRDLQPEIAKIKAKAKGDRQKESVLMMELFKEKEINPFGSLGLAFLQFPILIALFFVLKHIIDPNQINGLAYGFIAKLGTVKTIITNPQTFTPSLFGLVKMAKPSLVIALIAGLIQFVQTRQLMPKNQAGLGPQAQLGNTMGMIFPVITVAIGATLPSALSLYWAASSLIAIIQQDVVLNEDLSIMRKLSLKRYRHERSTRQ